MSGLRFAAAFRGEDAIRTYRPRAWCCPQHCSLGGAFGRAAVYVRAAQGSGVDEFEDDIRGLLKKDPRMPPCEVLTDDR